MGLLIIKVTEPPLHPVPKSHWNPKSMNKLTLNEPAKKNKTQKKINIIIYYRKKILCPPKTSKIKIQQYVTHTPMQSVNKAVHSGF